MDIEEVNVINSIRIGPFTVSLRTDGLVHVHATGEEIDLAGYKKLVEEMAKMTSWKKVPVLCTADEFFIPNEDVRKYLTKPESNPYSLATALVVSSISQKLVGNFFMTVMKPTRRIRIFTRKDDAIKWLRNYL
ncbi:MAG: STAS/SEC14 domain-containing protein [Bacteroidetes bacterium]|nr:STAS/SEC14 domain-containing protein [Bacteroidota bacterium]